MEQAVKWSNNGYIIVPAGVQSGLCIFQGRRQCATGHSLEHALTRWLQLLSQVLNVLPWDLQESLEGLHQCAPSPVHTEQNLSVLDLVTKEPLQSILSVQSTFHSTTARHVAHGVLVPHHAETTNSASQVEFPENPNIIKQSACQVADRGLWQCPQWFQPKSWCWTRLDMHTGG
jgi:hypothetical protein